MNDTPYTPEAMEQVGKIYDKLERLPADKRSVVMLMVDAFINGMRAQERLGTQSQEDRNSA